MAVSDRVKSGPEKAPHRSLWKALGLTDEELKLPLIGVVSAKSECVPGHNHLNNIAQAVKDGIRLAGGVPVEFPAIGHVSPEGASGGMIGLIEEGDTIAIDIPAGKLELKVDDATLAKRREAWVCPPPNVTKGYLARYAKLVSSANKGAVVE